MSLDIQAKVKILLLITDTTWLAQKVTFLFWPKLVVLIKIKKKIIINHRVIYFGQITTWLH